MEKCGYCGEHSKHVEQFNAIDCRVGEVKDSITSLTSYMPKIESMLVQLVNIQKTLEENTTTNRGIFQKLDSYKDELNEMKLTLTRHELFISNNEESKKELRGIRNTIIGAVVAAMLIGSVGVGITYVKMQSDLVKIIEKK